MALTQLREWLLAPFSNRGLQIPHPLHRRMLVVSGNDDFCKAALFMLRTLTDEVSSINVESFTGHTLKGKKRKHILGSECDIAIIDCRDAFKPGDVMAVAGIVKRNGCLILVCPAFSEWVTNVSVSFLSEGFILHRSRYLARFIEHLRKNAYVAFHTEAETLLPDLATYQIDPAQSQDAKKNSLFKTGEQEYVYNLVYQAYSSNSLNALITAPRGRGKSSLLGIFIDRLVKEGNNVLLTSEQKDNVTNVISRFQQIDLSNSPVSESKALNNEQVSAMKPAASKGFVKWVPSDSELLYCKKKGIYDLVVVDEAASIPLPVIARIMAHNSQWVLSTTLLGYEGSGSGFIHKLIPNLPNGTAHLTLSTPLRWADKDPIEAFLNATCLFEDNTVEAAISNLDVEHNLNLNQKCDFCMCSFEKMTEPMLQQVMSLLTLAHYQTTPDDFMRLMDSPDVLVATLHCDNVVLAAAIINIEGGTCLKGASSGIASGSRRPKGHLGAQRLTLLSADANAATYKYWRINRIAVHPNLQGRGTGSCLIRQLANKAREQTIDAVCTSYGTTTKLDRFWSRNGFEIVDYGRKPNKASGETSALAVLPNTLRAKALVTHLKTLKSSFERDINVHELPDYALKTYSNKLFQFTDGTRTLDDVWPILYKLTNEAQFNDNLIDHCRDNEYQSYNGEMFAERPISLGKVVRIMSSQRYLKSVFSDSDIDIERIKGILKTHGITVSGAKEITTVIRTLLKPAFN
ncbi:GNAT family N-acetyltransferase [Alteromonas sp. KUL106]|uniref:GNAT family N-acetyltransferase n=1 Tax=Alteromonas sp. KUL106 TaxID=2480799 RepID=UPI00135948E3|nr:GNAT family N-acetyltransferase [Alteromonas sp. KUL106]